VTMGPDTAIPEPSADDDAMPWALIDATGDRPFMPEGCEQPSPAPDRVVFEP